MNTGRTNTVNYSLFARETREIKHAQGSLLVAAKIPGIRYGEFLDIKLKNGDVKRGKAIDISGEATVVQVFGGVSEVDLANSTVRSSGQSLRLPVSKDMLGRIFNGMGIPIDNYPAIVPDEYLDINGMPINPASRQPPQEFIETGISAIDGLNSLVRGQKLPIFSGSGLPHNRIVAQIIGQSTIRGSGEKFGIVFGAVGISYDDATFFIRRLQETGAQERTVAFINTASDPVVERISTPRLAVTAAEYLAWEKGMHMLVVLSDMTNYCEALRELAAMREEIPSRRGYPGYMYTDMATIYERAGRIEGKKGSITILPILTMPDDDITHPIPDLTGYITEGQIVISRALERKGIYPPIDVFLSLSRMMKGGIGSDKTREDHNNVFMQLYAAYAEGNNLREISAIVGAEALNNRDKQYLIFADRFEKEFIGQGEQQRRSIIQTLDTGWRLLSILPKEDLKLINENLIRKYLPDSMGEN